MFVYLLVLVELFVTQSFYLLVFPMSRILRRVARVIGLTSFSRPLSLSLSLPLHASLERDVCKYVCVSFANCSGTSLYSSCLFV